MYGPSSAFLMNISLLLKDLHFSILIWKMMAKYGFAPISIAVVRQFHDGIQVRVQNDGQYSEPFPVTNSVKQGCVMPPTLFSMMFSAMLTDAFKDCDAGLNAIYLN